MGGPCRIITNDDEEITGPPCTDNFQIKPFQYCGYRFYSAEQAFQAFKFTKDSETFNTILGIVPGNNDDSSTYGNLVWQHGQCNTKDRNPDWEKIKIRTMLNINRAKYNEHKDLRDELLLTGNQAICGPSSTEWYYKQNNHSWTYWNGRIQMIIREELKNDDACNNELLSSLLQEIEYYENL